MPHGAFDPLNSRAKVAPRAGCRSGVRLTSPWFDAWNAWRTCSGRGRCHGPIWIRGEHTVACSTAGPNLGLLGQVFADFAIGPTKVVVQGLAIVAIPIVALTGDPVSGGLAPVWRQLQRDGVN